MSFLLRQNHDYIAPITFTLSSALLGGSQMIVQSKVFSELLSMIFQGFFAPLVSCALPRATPRRLSLAARHSSRHHFPLGASAVSTRRYPCPRCHAALLAFTGPCARYGPDAPRALAHQGSYTWRSSWSSCAE